MTRPPLGARYRCTVDFNAVPKGTTCTVVEHYGRDGISVEWDRPQDIERRGGKPPQVGRPISPQIGQCGLRDGFSPDDVRDFLEALLPEAPPKKPDPYSVFAERLANAVRDLPIDVGQWHLLTATVRRDVNGTVQIEQAQILPTE